jgi:hypothetical protein
MKSTCKNLVKLAGLGKACGHRFEFERRVHERTSILSDLRPGVTPKGNFSVRTVYLNEDGVEAAYDGNYEFDLTAIIVNGERHDLAPIDRLVR